MRRNDVRAQPEHGGRLKDNLIAGFEKAEYVVGALHERRALPRDGECIACHRRLVDTDANVTKLQGDARLRAGVLAKHHDVWTRGGQIIEAFVKREGECRRRLEEIDTIDSAAVLVDAAAEAGLAGLARVVAAELAIEIAFGGQNGRSADADGGRDRHKLASILERVERAVDDRAALHGIEVAPGCIDERIGS